MDRKDKIAVAVMIALVAGIGGFVLAADDHGEVGASYYFNLPPDPGVTPAAHLSPNANGDRIAVPALTACEHQCS